MVLFNASAGGVLRSGPLVHLACRLRRARFIVRLFGGDLDTAVGGAPAPLRWLFRAVTRRADLMTVETQALCAHFGRDGAAAEWLRWWPNTRELAGRPRGAGATA